MADRPYYNINMAELLGFFAKGIGYANSPEISNAKARINLIGEPYPFIIYNKTDAEILQRVKLISLKSAKKALMNYKMPVYFYGISTNIPKGSEEKIICSLYSNFNNTNTFIAFDVYLGEKGSKPMMSKFKQLIGGSPKKGTTRVFDEKIANNTEYKFKTYIFGMIIFYRYGVE